MIKLTASREIGVTSGCIRMRALSVLRLPYAAIAFVACTRPEGAPRARVTETIGTARAQRMRSKQWISQLVVALGAEALSGRHGRRQFGQCPLLGRITDSSRTSR